ncbi:MAG TPA: beta-phosphoglucomutase [Patescibacteria group bacterium]|nr:beta-phosphoglucomutase [Patescibacteria group bacterium]
MSSLEAVIFDMDGVLTETSRQHYLAWKLLAKDLGFEITEEINEQVKGISRLESLDIVLRAGNMEDKFTKVEKVELADKKNLIYQSLIKEFTVQNLSEGALELLKALKDQKVKIALASVSKNAPFLLKAMEIEAYFDAVADPSQAKMGKPAPDIFLLAAQKLGVDPKNCVGIEDAFAGVEAIKSAGMKPVGIGNKEVLYNCERVFSSLADVNIELLWNI